MFYSKSYTTRPLSCAVLVLLNLSCAVLVLLKAYIDRMSSGWLFHGIQIKFPLRSLLH